MNRTIAYNMVNGYKKWEYHYASQPRKSHGTQRTDAERQKQRYDRMSALEKIFARAIKTAQKRSCAAVPTCFRKLVTFSVGDRCWFPSGRAMVCAVVVAVRGTSRDCWALVQRNRVHQREVHGVRGRRPQFCAVREAYIK